jgi:hypothetical protein
MRLRPLAVALACGTLSAAAFAAVPSQISVQSLPASTAGTEAQASNADVSYSFRISNNSATPAPATLTVRSTTRSGGQSCPAAGCTLGWSLEGAAVAPDQPQALTVAPYSSKTLTYSGRAEALGVYYSEALVAEGGEAGTPVSIKITRALPQLGENPISVSPPGPRTRWFSDSDPVIFTIANQTDQAVALAKGVTARIQRDMGDQVYIDLKNQPSLTCD